VAVASDFRIIEKCKKNIALLLHKQSTDNLAEIPDEELPYLRSIFNINLLGIDTWGKLFLPRQLIVITTLLKIINSINNQKGFPQGDLGKAIKTCLSFAIDRHIDQQSSLVTWIPNIEAVSHTFVRQALGITWDFCEPNPISDSGGNISGAIEWVVKVLLRESSLKGLNGQVEMASACSFPLPDNSASLACTDPPYYDAVPYADLSDFFYVWLRRMLKNEYPDLFKNELTPKKHEIVQLAERNDIYAYKTKENFENLMTKALSDMRRTTVPTGLGVIVFAHKETSAWETMIASVIDSGWTVVASWPIDTERTVRLRAMNSAALGSSIHLVCRPRENPDGTVTTNEIGDWRDVLSELPERIHGWMPRLADEGIVGADAIFSCLGPALEIFSRYSSVEKASGEKVELKEYLEHVWSAVAKEALRMIFEGADATGFEEDARLTAMWLWTIRTNINGNGDSEDDEGKTKTIKGYTLEFDAARKIAQGLGAHLENLGHLVETKGDKAILLSANSRVRYLFGKNADDSPKGLKKTQTKQMKLDFEEEFKKFEEESSKWSGDLSGRPGGTVFDQLHQSMILFGAGRGEALKRLLIEDGIGRNPLYWRLAQSLSALYPTGTEEKRWVDGVLARKKSLGF